MTFSSRIHRSSLALLMAAAAGLGACDGGARPLPDAEGSEAGYAQPEQNVSELVVRLDAPSGELASASLVAFRAKVVGLEPDQVAGAVDPLLLASPDGRCALRQVDETIRLLREARGGVELEALSRFAVELSPSVTLRPVPRVYPDLAAVVTGVVAEAGPEDLVELPQSLTLKSEAGGDVVISLPGLPQVTGPDGNVITSGSKLGGRNGLHLTVTGPRGAFVELRPFGATTWAACPVGADGRVTIPAELMGRLAGVAGEVPVSLDVVWRSRRTVQLGGEAARLSLETRASALVELGL